VTPEEHARRAVGACLKISTVDLLAAVIDRMGEDVTRRGLLGTPERIERSWGELYAGYYEDPAQILDRKFKADGANQMVVLRNVEFYSTCEHHLLPFIGKAHVAYLPADGIVVGISKLARLVECFARRLQIQERLTDQIANALVEHLHPLGVGVVMEAQHLCMTARGVSKQNSVMVTSALRGAFIDDAQTREEFMSCVRGR
jgi:GTP cyclohydrolase I